MNELQFIHAGNLFHDGFLLYENIPTEFSPQLGNIPMEFSPPFSSTGKYSYGIFSSILLHLRNIPMEFPCQPPSH